MAVKSFITLVPEVKKWKKMFITKKLQTQIKQNLQTQIKQNLQTQMELKL
jgi:hypothetical protein